MEITLIVCALYLSLGELVLSTNCDAEPEVSKSAIASLGLGHKDYCPFSPIKTSSSLYPSGYFKYMLTKSLLRHLIMLQQQQHLALYFIQNIQPLLYVSRIIMPV